MNSSISVSSFKLEGTGFSSYTGSLKSFSRIKMLKYLFSHSGISANTQHSTYQLLLLNNPFVPSALFLYSLKR